jgi:hypothetical protein
MYQMDYIMRTIKQFSEMLVALLFGARARGQEVTFDDLDELSLAFTGLTLDTLTRLDSSQIINLFSVTGELDINKVYVSARLLYQLAEQEGSAEKATGQKRKALDLSLEVYQRLGEYLNEEHEALTQSLKNALWVNPS